MSVKMTLRSASVKTEHRESTFVLRPMTGAGTEAAGPRAPRLREAGELQGSERLANPLTSG